MPNVHKDFHGALSYGLQFLEDCYGLEGVRDFLSGLADTVYKPLVEDIHARGLIALREHWQTVFGREEGDYEISMEDSVLVLAVRRCPAIAHMKDHGYSISKHFCEHTRIVNEAICNATGYASNVEYDQHAGSCIQRFWRK